MAMDPPVARTGGQPLLRDHVIRIRVSAVGLESLDQFAASEQRTRSDMIRLLLRDGMEARTARLGKR